MDHRVVNFKFYLLMALVIPVFVLSVSLVCFSYGFARLLGIILIVLSLSYCMIILSLEPLYYIIDESGIFIRLVFSEKNYMWKEIASMNEVYDAVFGSLFVKDYIIHKKNNFKEVRRNERIVKCKKSTALIKKYSQWLC